VRADDLRAVLLVKAVEETDREGRLLPSAERAAAARAARREHPHAAAMEILLAARAQKLLPRLLEPHPGIASLLSITREPRWIAAAFIAISLAGGFALSALDGTRTINILGFPLLGVVLWNLAVYALLLYRPTFSGQWLASAMLRLAARRARQGSISDALVRFVHEWSRAAGTLYRLRAARMLHLAALAFALGLIGGLYLRGLVLEYRASWASTFLDAAQVRALLAAVYGPASLVTGVPLPSVVELEAIGARGENAARWIHLMAATAMLFIGLPRAVLALAASAALLRRGRALEAPASLPSYFRDAFARVDGLGRAKVRVLPYAYEPSPAAAERLRELLPELLGGELAIETEASTPYGEEDALLAQIEVAGGADVLVLLFSLAATPEEENHGVLIGGARDLVARAGPRNGPRNAPIGELVVLVDEAPYAARLAGEGAARERLAERRALWQAFSRARGVDARIVDFGKPRR
jgi:hypothetical protein